MAQLVPSILENTKEAFALIYNQEVKLPGVSRIQVDFADGVFVPNKILPVTEIDGLNPAFHWEAHLMIKEPKDFLDYQICGFKTIILHYEAFKNIDDLKAAINEIKSMGMEPGVCLKNGTSVTNVIDFKNIVRHFQLMSVDPGFQGTPFIESTYERIVELRKLMPDAIIEVDGGVKLENVKKIAEAGADLMILGSAITKQPDMLQAYEKLQNELNRSNENV